MDFDLRDYSKSGSFIKKDDLRASGPLTLTIASVEEADGLSGRDGKPPAKELVLVFTDGTKFQLGAATNRQALADMHGYLTSAWLGKSIELYCDPTVRNPSGAKVGGIRITRPDGQDADEEFTSDLEEAPPTKGNGAGRPAAAAKAARTAASGRVTAARPSRAKASEPDDEIPY
jgi:hypothetical protein